MPTNLPGSKNMTRDQAVVLTQQIHSALVAWQQRADDLWQLVEEARIGEVWKVLGYGSWAGYCEREFAMTDRNARYLLGKAEVMRELEAAAGVELPAETVSARAATAVRPSLPAVAEEVRGAVKGTRKTRRPAIVQDIVSGARSKAEALPAATQKPIREKAPEPQPRKSSDPPVSADERVLAAAAAIPKLIRLSPADVAKALPERERGRIAEQLRRWASDLEAEAKGYAKGNRDRAAQETEKQSDCHHPIGRRLGSVCGACGKSIAR